MSSSEHVKHAVYLESVCEAGPATVPTPAARLLPLLLQFRLTAGSAEAMGCSRPVRVTVLVSDHSSTPLEHFTHVRTNSMRPSTAHLNPTEAPSWPSENLAA